MTKPHRPSGTPLPRPSRDAPLPKGAPTTALQKRKRTAVYWFQLLLFLLCLYAFHAGIVHNALLRRWTEGGNGFVEEPSDAAYAAPRKDLDHPRTVPASCDPHSAEDTVNKNAKRRSLAVCISGSLTEFELSGPSIIRHVLQYYRPLISFFSIPLDKHTHKISLLLRAPNSSISVHIRPPYSESWSIKRKLLNPNGFIGELRNLLEYFELVEDCSRLISNYEKENHVKLKWIMLGRTDSYWSHHPPPLSSFTSKSLFLPPSFLPSQPSSIPSSLLDNNGEPNSMNDRLFLGRSNISLPALQMSTMFGHIMATRNVTMHSQWLFSKQLSMQNISANNTVNFPFCTLDRPPRAEIAGAIRRYVASLNNSVPLNGMNCRPCAPSPSSLGNLTLVSRPVLRNVWNLDSTVQLCNSTSDVPWTTIRERFYDLILDETTTQVRRHIRTRNYWQCLKENLILRSRALAYTGPPSSVLCALGAWGNYRRIGFPRFNWYALPKAFNPKCVIYSFGLEANLHFEEYAFSSFDCDVHAFDCMRSITQSPKIADENSTRIFKRHKLCLGWIPTNASALLFSLNTSALALQDPIIRRSKTLQSIMKMLNHQVVDLVKIDVGKRIFSLLIKGLDFIDGVLPVCQLVVKFQSKTKVNDLPKERVISALEKKGLYLTMCLGDKADEKCHFLSSHVCLV